MHEDIITTTAAPVSATPTSTARADVAAAAAANGVASEREAGDDRAGGERNPLAPAGSDAAAPDLEDVLAWASQLDAQRDAQTDAGGTPAAREEPAAAKEHARGTAPEITEAHRTLIRAGVIRPSEAHEYPAALAERVADRLAMLGGQRVDSAPPPNQPSGKQGGGMTPPQPQSGPPSGPQANTADDRVRVSADTAVHTLRSAGFSAEESRAIIAALTPMLTAPRGADSDDTRRPRSSAASDQIVERMVLDRFVAEQRDAYPELADAATRSAVYQRALEIAPSFAASASDSPVDTLTRLYEAAAFDVTYASRRKTIETAGKRAAAAAAVGSPRTRPGGGGAGPASRTVTRLEYDTMVVDLIAQGKSSAQIDAALRGVRVRDA